MTWFDHLLGNTAVAIGTSTELSLSLKVTVLLAAGLVAARLLSRASASARHAVLAGTFAGVLVLPLAAAWMPAWRVAVPVAAPAPSVGDLPMDAVSAGRDDFRPAIAVTQPRTAAVAPLDATGIVRWIWGLGALASALFLAAGLWNLRRIRRTAVPVLSLQREADALAAASGVRRPVSVVTHEDLVAPLTFGIRRPLIALPPDAREWNADATRRTLVHELEHARRFDWAWHVGARLACALFWFHPLAWAAWRQLRLEAERACDDAVLRTSDGADYAEQLVALARRISGRPPRASLAMAGRSDLSVRVSALLDPHQRRSRAGAVSLATAALVTLVLVVTMAPVRALAVPQAGKALALGDGTQDRQRPQDRSLYHASRRGDLQRMAALIDGGADVNAAIDGDGSPLIGAARAGHLPAVTLLLDRGADPNLAVPGDGSALIMAAREGHRDIVALLLDRGALIDQVVPSDESALMQASASGHAEVVKLLIARGANVNLRVWADLSGPQAAGEWRTALSMAQRGGHEAVVRLLASAGAVR